MSHYKTIHSKMTEAELTAFKVKCAKLKIHMADVTGGLVREWVASDRDMIKTDVGGKIIGFKRSKANE